jgi:hypothetical protein
MPFRMFETMEAANAVDNLIALCDSCHGRKTATVERLYVKRGDTVGLLRFVDAVRGESIVDRRGGGMTTPREARDAGIARVESGCDPTFRGAAFAAILYLAERREEFTTDPVWLLLRRWGVATPEEPRVMAVPIGDARRRGLIAKTARTVPSVRPESHMAELRVWRSLIYVEAAA